MKKKKERKTPMNETPPRKKNDDFQETKTHEDTKEQNEIKKLLSGL